MAKKNRLIDLNDMLFEQIQNIQDPEENTNLELEIKKSAAISQLAGNVIEIHKLAFKASQERGTELDYLDYQFGIQNKDTKSIEPSTN